MLPRCVVCVSELDEENTYKHEELLQSLTALWNESYGICVLGPAHGRRHPLNAGKRGLPIRVTIFSYNASSMPPSSHTQPNRFTTMAFPEWARTTANTA